MDRIIKQNFPAKVWTCKNGYIQSWSLLDNQYNKPIYTNNNNSFIEEFAYCTKNKKFMFEVQKDHPHKVLYYSLRDAILALEKYLLDVSRRIDYYHKMDMKLKK